MAITLVSVSKSPMAVQTAATAGAVKTGMTPVRSGLPRICLVGVAVGRKGFHSSDLKVPTTIPTTSAVAACIVGLFV